MATTSLKVLEQKLELAKTQLARERRKARNLQMMDLSMEMDINTGAGRTRPEDLLQRDRPGTPQDAYIRARAFGQENWFIEIVNALKVAFFNYGLRVQPLNKKDKDALNKKLEDAATRLALRRYIKEVWKERVGVDTVVSFWRVSAATTPFLLLPETCDYKDALGLQRLKVKLNWKPDDFKDAGNLNKSETLELAKRYGSQKQITLSEDNDEYFSVLTRGLRGHGFTHPRLLSCFRTLNENESLEVGEQMLALALRRVFTHTRMGWELKGAAAGANADKQKEFAMWTQKRHKASVGFRKGRFGHMDTSGNFDETTELIWGGKGFDVKWLTGDKWGTIERRLMWYGAPVSYMIVTKSVNPFLLGMFKALADDERNDVGPYCEHVINAGFGLGVPVKLGWSNRCFNDARLAWDMVKALMLQGPLSLKTALEQADFDPAQETERKIAEAGADPETLLPLHNPNTTPGGPGGRPPEKGAGSVNPPGKK